ncbi:MAG: hypothetical protein P8Q41_12450 [Saprospiraceae bacterium]|nr:hypothetical protein [Saprospiraceae bacterium]
MNTFVGRKEENKNQSVANEVSQKRRKGETTYQFVDNRPEVVSQRKLQEMTNNSQQVSQLKSFQVMANNSPKAKQTVQLQSKADNQPNKQQNPIQKKENNTLIYNSVEQSIQPERASNYQETKDNNESVAQLVAYKRIAEKLTSTVVQRVGNEDDPLASVNAVYKKADDKRLGYAQEDYVSEKRMKAIGPIDNEANDKMLAHAKEDYISKKRMDAISPVDNEANDKMLAHAKEDYISKKRVDANSSVDKEANDKIQEYAKEDYIKQKQIEKFDGKLKNEQLEELSVLKNRGEQASVDQPDESLGADLTRIQKDMDYNFDPDSDHHGKVRRFVGKKAAGAAHYAYKHPLKTVAKAVPLAPVIMNTAGAIKSHVRSKDARKEQKDEDATQAEQLMWRAHKKGQQKNRNKKGFSAAVGLGTTLAGGALDFGAGEAAGQIFSETGNAFADGALSEAVETAAAFVGQTSAGDATEAFSLALGEAASEDFVGGLLEDGQDGANTGISNKRQKGKTTASDDKNLIKKGRLARKELNKDGGDKGLAHESLLAKDLSYGKTLRETVRNKLDSPAVLPGDAAPNTTPLGINETSLPQERMKEFEKAKANKANTLNLLKETAKTREDDPSAPAISNEHALTPSVVKKEQQGTKAMAYTRLNRQLGYEKDGETMSKKQAVEKDKKIDNFKKKSFYEA